jgi:hypothetical protein
MIEGIGTVSNVNQDKIDTVQGQTEGPQETTPDVVEGKVNPVDPPDNLSNEPTSNEESHSKDVLNRGSGEERIIDVIG